MTTITTTKLRRSSRYRMTRNVIAALAAAALLAPSALVISRINDNDSHRIAAMPAAPPMGPASVADAAAEVCRGGLEWACDYTRQIEVASSGSTSVTEAAAEVCRGGLEWACDYARQWVGQN